MPTSLCGACSCTAALQEETLKLPAPQKADEDNEGPGQLSLPSGILLEARPSILSAHHFMRRGCSAAGTA